jgi:hypothetical protein
VASEETGSRRSCSRLASVASLRRSSWRHHSKRRDVCRSRHEDLVMRPVTVIGDTPDVDVC